MNTTEAKMTLAVLKAAYPGAYRGMSADELVSTVKLWQTMFAGDDYGAVIMAVKSLIATRVEGYPPTIGAVKEEMLKLRDLAANTLTAQDAWALVDKATRNGLWGYQREYDKLPPIVQKAVGSPEQLKAWAAMDAETVQSVVASNFMKNYRVVQSRERERGKLPPDVHNFLTALSNKLAISDGR